MPVSRKPKLRPWLAVAAMLCALAASAQAPDPSSAANPFYGSITAHPATDDVIRLSLDDAIQRGLENNLGLKQAEYAENAIHGQKLQALQEFLPTISLYGDTGFHQYNLAAQGFGPGLIKKFPGGMLPPGFSFITRATVTEGQIRFKQTLFSGPVIAGWRAAGAATRAAHFATMRARGEVVQQVASAYLHAIAAASEVDNAKALEQVDQVSLNQAHEAHQAGTASNLDELRARVQLQAQQQALIAAQNTLDKDLILLKREIGLDPGQNLVLSDRAPYSELAAQTPEEVRAIALQEPPGLPVPAEPGGRAQGHPQRVPQPAPAHPELQRLLRRHTGRQRGLARHLRGRRNPQLSAVSRSPPARRRRSLAGPARAPPTPSSKTCAAKSTSRCAPPCST